MHTFASVLIAAGVNAKAKTSDRDLDRAVREAEKYLADYRSERK